MAKALPIIESNDALLGNYQNLMLRLKATFDNSSRRPTAIGRAVRSSKEISAFMSILFNSNGILEMCVGMISV